MWWGLVWPIPRTRGWGEPVVAAGCRGVSLAFPAKWLRHRGRAAARRARRAPAPRLMPSLVTNFISSAASAASAAVVAQLPPARSTTLPFRHAIVTPKINLRATPACARARARTSAGSAPTHHSAINHVEMVWGECARGATAVTAQRPPPRWPVAAQPVARSASGRRVSVPPPPPALAHPLPHRYRVENVAGDCVGGAGALSDRGGGRHHDPPNW